MSETKLRVILLTHGGAEAVLEKLLALDGVQVAGVFIETKTSRPYSLRKKIERSIRYDGYAATIAKLARKFFVRGVPVDADAQAIEDSRGQIRELAEAHNVPLHFVADYHMGESTALMREAEADLGVVYGTNIIKESVFKLPRLGSINLHQGRAPLYRGGPPVFWELFNDESEVGLTVHFVAAKVDTGEIILQELVPLAYDYSYGSNFESYIARYREQLNERCAQLVVESVRLIAEGTAHTQPQDTSIGRRYRLPTKKEKDELRRRLRARQRSRSAGHLLAHSASVKDQ